jgi:hypothetical protein
LLRLKKLGSDCCCCIVVEQFCRGWRPLRLDDEAHRFELTEPWFSTNSDSSSILKFEVRSIKNVNVWNLLIENWTFTRLLEIKQTHWSIIFYILLIVGFCKMSALNSQPIRAWTAEEFNKLRRNNYNGSIVPHLKHAGMIFERNSNKNDVEYKKTPKVNF